MDNTFEFSRDWLARSEFYMRTLRFKQANPSVGTLAMCASKLQQYGRYITVEDAYTKLGNKLSEHSIKKINTDAKGWWG